MKERHGLERELEALGVRAPIPEFQVGPPSSPTLGFEFDLNYGFEKEVADAKGAMLPSTTPTPNWTKFRWPREYLKVTDHEHKDEAKTKLKDGFVVTKDAVRMEISTIPIHITDDKEFNTVVDSVLKFGHELAHSRKTLTRKVPGVYGRPATFEHPRTVVNKQEVDASRKVKFPGDRDKASYMLHPVPLVIHRVRNEYPPITKELWSSPQATVTLPLSEFGKLVWLINESKKERTPGVAFAGRIQDRLGLRDDLAWFALKCVWDDKKKMIGKKLSDGRTVADRDFTRSISSVVTILIMYMLTSLLKDKYDRDEKEEGYSKGSLPLNLKTPLWQIHKEAMTPHEKLILHELYTDPAKRMNLYTLAHKAKTKCIKASGGTVKAAGGTGSDENRKLFPDYTHGDIGRFHVDIPTWRTLIEALVDEKKVIVTKDADVQKKGHRIGDEILIAPLSSKIDWNITKPLIAVEMRRLGFAPVKFGKDVGKDNLWRGLMDRIRCLARQVNSLPLGLDCI